MNKGVVYLVPCPIGDNSPASVLPSVGNHSRENEDTQVSTALAEAPNIFPATVPAIDAAKTCIQAHFRDILAHPEIQRKTL